MHIRAGESRPPTRSRCLEATRYTRSSLAPTIPIEPSLQLNLERCEKQYHRRWYKHAMTDISAARQGIHNRKIFANRLPVIYVVRRHSVSPFPLLDLTLPDSIIIRLAMTGHLPESLLRTLPS